MRSCFLKFIHTQQRYQIAKAHRFPHLQSHSINTTLNMYFIHRQQYSSSMCICHHINSHCQFLMQTAWQPASDTNQHPGDLVCNVLAVAQKIPTRHIHPSTSQTTALSLSDDTSAQMIHITDLGVITPTVLTLKLFESRTNTAK